MKLSVKQENCRRNLLGLSASASEVSLLHDSVDIVSAIVKSDFMYLYVYYNGLHLLKPFQRHLFQIAAIRRVQRHTGLTQYF